MIYTVLTYAFGAIALLCFAGGWVKRSKRLPLFWAGSAAGIAAVAASTNIFWSLILFGLMVPWALFTATSVMTSAWRTKVGLAVYLAAGAALALFPTYHDEVACSVPEGQALAPTCPLAVSALDVEARTQAIGAWEAGNAGMKRFLLQNISFRMVRGLDLKGGLRLVYSVDVEEAIKDKRDRYYDDLRSELTKAFGLAAGDVPTVAEMRQLSERVTISKPRDEVNIIKLTFTDGAQSKKLINDEFLVSFLRELSIVRSTDGTEVTFRIRSEVETAVRDKAVQQAKETVNRRIDGMGVKEASVSVRDEDIIVEIPGQDERAFQEIRDIISQTARLEFKLPDDDVDFFEPYHKAEDVPQGLDWELMNVSNGPGKTPQRYVPVLLKQKTETLEEAFKRATEWAATLPVDEDHEIAFGKLSRFNDDKDTFETVGWRGYYLWGKAQLTGDLVRDARAQADQSDSGLGSWAVSMDLTPRGGEMFGDLTERNVKKRFAIVLDGKVESAPVIQEKIGGGTARITMGSGSLQQQMKDSQKLELVLRSGALPAPIAPSNEQRIGPSLGADSIGQGVRAAAVGAVLVLGLMLLSYKKAGLIANIAVTFNLFLQMAVLAMFSASLTLPGIAGFALTVGVAVDANVLINERIREEVLGGKSVRAAVTLGYDKAFSAIVDGHATTLISGLILWQFGTGPIKGFAITLIIGMLTSLFTGVVITRLFFEFWVRGRRDVSLGIS